MVRPVRGSSGRIARLLKCSLLLSGALAIPAAASVIVLGNYKTGEVIIQGNLPGGGEVARAVGLATGGEQAGWTQIYGPDDDSRGWGGVLCVKHAKGVFFAEAIGETSEAEANRTLNMKVERFLARLVDQAAGDAIERSASWPGLARTAVETGLGTIVKCAPAWNDQGQQIDYVGKPLDVSDVAAESPRADEAIEKPAGDKETQAADEAPQSAEEAARPADEAPRATTEVATAPASPKRDYDAEFQAKMQQWEAAEAERQKQVAEYEEAKRRFEQDKIAQAERSKQAQEAYQRALEEHAVQVAAVAEENLRREAEYQQQLANPGRSAGPIIDFPEAVSVCALDPNDPQSKFGNWKCVGPLQFDYAKLGAGGESAAAPLGGVANSCGGKVERLRDLGMVNGYRVFGCSFGINPDPRISLSRDAAKQFGLDFIDGRKLFRCPASKSSCGTE